MRGNNLLRVALLVRDFSGSPDILEVVCSGTALASDVSLLTMTLYSVPSNHVQATASVFDDQCTTTGVFASCLVDRQNSRKSQLKMLVMNLEVGTRLGFGCEITSVKSGQRSSTSSWTIEVQRKEQRKGKFS
ncbi:hypothetical protein ACOMHN_035395 [Nucella lapillus]